MTATLATPDFALRPLAAADRDAVAALYADAEVMHHLGGPMPPAKARAVFAAALARQHDPHGHQRFWMLQAHADAAVMGLMGLTLHDRTTGEVGILVDPRHRGRDHAAAAIAALADHMFDDLGMARLDARHGVGNTATARLLAKLDFERLPLSRADLDQRWTMTPVRWRQVRGRWRGASQAPADRLS